MLRRLSEKCLAAIQKALESDCHTLSVAEAANLEDPESRAKPVSHSAFLVCLRRVDRGDGNHYQQDGTNGTRLGTRQQCTYWASPRCCVKVRVCSRVEGLKILTVHEQEGLKVLPVHESHCFSRDNSLVDNCHFSKIQHVV